MNTVTHWHKAPWGVVSVQIPPSCLFSLILPLSLDSFSDMPAQAHLAAHVLPPALPCPPFTFLPCDISMATWKETSVLGEQCGEVGCYGWGGHGRRRVDRATGVRSMPAQRDRGIPGLATTELGLNVRGGHEQSGLLSHNEQSIWITQSSKTTEPHQ